MDFLSVPSLEYLCCAEIALAVFYNPDVYKLAFDYHLPSTLRPDFYKLKRLTLKSILVVAVDKISTLTLPSSYPMKVRNLILNLIHELWLWKQSLHTFLDINKVKTVRPFWTKKLTIDRAKTARILIETKRFDAPVCFLLACKYCFFDDAVKMWRNMSPAQKTAVVHMRRVRRYSPLEIYIRDCDLPESQRNLETFTSFVETRNIPLDEHAVCLILPTKPAADQTKVLLSVATNTSLYDFQPDFKLRCLQQLGKDWQEEILKTQSFNVLRCLLTWPFESHFLDVAENTWDYLSPTNFGRILETFVFSLESYEWQNFEVAEILKKFWEDSPENFKEYAKGVRVFEPLNILLNCNSLETLDSNILQDAYQKFAASKILEAFVGVPG